MNSITLRIVGSLLGAIVVCFFSLNLRAYPTPDMYLVNGSPHQRAPFLLDSGIRRELNAANLVMADRLHSLGLPQQRGEFPKRCNSTALTWAHLVLGSRTATHTLTNILNLARRHPKADTHGRIVVASDGRLDHAIRMATTLVPHDQRFNTDAELFASQDAVRLYENLQMGLSEATRRHCANEICRAAVAVKHAVERDFDRIESKLSQRHTVNGGTHLHKLGERLNQNAIALRWVVNTQQGIERSPLHTALISLTAYQPLISRSELEHLSLRARHLAYEIGRQSGGW